MYFYKTKSFGMKSLGIFIILFVSTFTFGQIVPLKKEDKKEENKETPCYEKANELRRKGVSLLECGKLVGYIDCNEELEFDEDSGIFLRKAKDMVNRNGAGKPYTGGCESCYMNGLLERRVTFVNGRENGIDTSYYADGCIQAVRSHIQGAESGTWKYYYDSTTVLAWEMNFYLGEKHGKQVNFKPNGDTTKLETYKNGILHGPKRQYFKESKIYKDANYVNGLMDGVFRIYNAKGTVIEELNYKANQKNGVQKYYYEDGVLLRTENWTNGVKTGEFKMFYYQGHVQSLETYNKTGQKEGKFEEYYPDQRPKRLAVYAKDVLVEDHHFDEHGNETYSFGTPVTSDAEDDQIKKPGKKK